MLAKLWDCSEISAKPAAQDKRHQRGNMIASCRCDWSPFPPFDTLADQLPGAVINPLLPGRFLDRACPQNCKRHTGWLTNSKARVVRRAGRALKSPRIPSW